MDSVLEEGKKLVVGIDFGSADSYVAYITEGKVDIVQNEVSQRKTPTLVGFTDKERLLGDAALSQIKSNTKNTCRNFKHLLGLKHESVGAQPEKFWATSALGDAPGGSAGFSVNYKGEAKVFSAVEITAMFFTKLKEITEAWCHGEIADAVVAVPAFFSDIHRRALLDAAHIAGLNVLRVINEHAATALGYGIFRNDAFDSNKPTTVAFCSMGHTVFSVSIVQFKKGKLNVLCEKSDKVGGRDMDECLMRRFAERFQKQSGCDPLSASKPQFKLEDSVTKTKKILSANSEASISVECLMEEQDFSGTITRDDFLEMCKPMMEKVQAVLEAAIAMCGMPVTDIDTVEMCGGASRVPWVKEMCSKAFGGKDLSTTLNADECVARGCAVQAGILSNLYKVREFKVEDISPYPVSLSFMGAQVNGNPPAEKSGVVFPAKSSMHLLKLVTFQRKEPFDLTLKYAEPAALHPGTPEEIARYTVEVPQQTEAKKVKVKALLSLHGTYSISGALLLEEEAKSEENAPPPIPPVDGAKPEESAADVTMTDAAKAEKRKEDSGSVSKARKRYKRTELNVKAATLLGLTAEQLEEGRQKEEAIKADMREIRELGALRNDVEAYILNMKGGLQDKYSPFAAPGTQQDLQKAFDEAETWLWDHMDDAKQVFVEKLAELRKLGDPIQHRWRESDGRASAIESLRKAMARSKEKTSGSRQADPTHLSTLETARSETTSWLAGKEAEQGKLAKHEDPVLLCADLESRIENINKLTEACEPEEAADNAPETSFEVD